MFTCSICDETFVGVHQDSTYTTRCGHVFHYNCLITWLQRSHTCPHCRSNVVEDTLIKLFLQVDPNARITWNRKAEEQINLLNNELNNLRQTENRHAYTIYDLKSQLKHAVEEHNKSIQFLKVECENYKFRNSDLRDQIKDQSLKSNNLLEAQKNNFEIQLQLEKSKNKSLEKNLYEVHSVNSVVIDKLKCEIADLKVEKAYFQSRCHNLEGGVSNIASTSKMNIENTEIPVQEIQIKNEFYGHDPLLKLSSKYFLLGCVFLIVEDRNQYEDICNDTSMSKLNIIEHGGLVEQLYSSRITHLICVSQKHSLVEQGLRDGKRCVTDYWLSDVLAKRTMSPPWLSHHFPTPYSIETGLPCQEFQIAIANFDINENHIIKTMIELIGGNVVDAVSSSTDVVVSQKLKGEMVEKALALVKPVVNVQWLNDIIFGAKIGIKDPKNNRYQQYDLPDPFSVNYDMVSDLMAAWKTPVIYLKNQHVYDLTDSSEGPSKCKIRKTTNENSELIDLVDDDDDNDVIITYVSNNKNKSKKLCVTLCGFSSEEEVKLNQIIVQLGGKVPDKSKETTHLVMKKNLKTIKLLSCLSTVNHIINENWLKDSNYYSKFINENMYHITEIYDGNNVVCNVPKVLANPKRQQLFKNLMFFITPGVYFSTIPKNTWISDIIIAAGGTVDSKRRSILSIQNLPPNTYFIISCNDDLHMVNDLLQINYVIYSTDFVTESIMKQNLELQFHSISSSTTPFKLL